MEYAAECADLVVPENRSDPDSRLISIPIMRIHSTGNQTAAPVFYLSGGSGESNFRFYGGRVAWFIEQHDIVLLGYRGVDGSVRLDCPEVSAHIKNLPGDMLGETSLGQMAAAYSDCAQRLQTDGVDLAGYTPVEVVDDVEAARLALGFEKINLFSISYDTRLAMIYAWRYPESIQRSAMVGVNPPGHMFTYDPAVIDQQIEYYAQLCAQDPKCKAKTENLAETIRAVSHNLPKRWLGIPLDRGMLRAASFESISDTLPAGLGFIELITLDPPSSGTIIDKLPILVTDLEIGVGAQVTVTLPVRVDEALAAGTLITNTASVTSDQVTVPVSASVSITVAEPDTRWIYLPLIMTT